MYYSMQRSIINFSVPRELEKEITKMAKDENKTKSELLREAFRVYKWNKAWAKIRLLGEQTAEKYGLESYDDIENFLG